MAAKKSAGCCGTLSELPPTLYLSFDDPAELEGLKTGDEVTVVVHGKITGLSQRESKDYTSASIDLERYDVKVKDGNVFKQLMEDE